MPPVNIRVRDHRQFGRRPTVGIHVLKSLEKYRVEPVMAGEREEEGSCSSENLIFIFYFYHFLPTTDPAEFHDSVFCPYETVYMKY